MNGFKLASASPRHRGGGELEQGSSNVKDTGYGDGMSVGSYKTSMDGVSVQMGAGFRALVLTWWRRCGRSRPSKVGAAGVTLVALTHRQLGSSTLDSNVQCRHSYKMGDLTIGGGVGSSTTETSGAQDDTDTVASVSFSYAVAPGVKAGAGLHFEENDGYDDDAVGAVMAIQMSF